MMKQLITIILVVGWGKLATAQVLNTYADTANYLVNEVAAKKYNYIGKPLSTLLDSLIISPVIVMNANNSKDNFGKRIAFEFNGEREFSNAHFITVTFVSVPSYNTLYPIFYPGGGLGGSYTAITDTYKPLIIQEIVVKDYATDDDPDPTIGVKKPVKN